MIFSLDDVAGGIISRGNHAELGRDGIVKIRMKRIERLPGIVLGLDRFTCQLARSKAFFPWECGIQQEKDEKNRYREQQAIEYQIAAWGAADLVEAVHANLHEFVLAGCCGVIVKQFAVMTGGKLPHHLQHFQPVRNCV